MAMKHYIKQAKTKIKWWVYNADRGVWEQDTHAPGGHSGKLVHVFTMAGGPPVPLAIPAGFEAVITRVDWDIFTAPAGAELWTLDDGIRFISILAYDGVSPFPSLKAGNGSGVIGKAQGNLTINALIGAFFGSGTVSVEYYLVPLV